MLDLYYNPKDSLAVSDIKNGIIKNRNNYYHHSLYGKTLALIGTGAIGSKVAKVAGSLGMIVKGFIPNLSKDKAKALGIIYCTNIKEALKNTDILSIQIPYTLAGQPNPTINIIGQQEIELLNHQAVIINVSRRDVINMESMLDALHSGRISGFSLDTMQSEIEELIRDYPNIISYPNIYITPSIATASVELKAELTEQTLLRIFWYWEENRAVNKVN
jgi:phosphoglycerate dehydrogenase-like enzyme